MTKKILITGKNSYIGRSFIEYCEKNQIDFDIDELDVHGDEWKDHDFSLYDSVFHVAGIAHIKETKENEEIYYKVNRDLAFEIAQKSKIDGVKQFVFLSTMSVYGIDTGVIKEDTPTKPKNAYGKSKLEAEILIEYLQDTTFYIAIVRPPMVYGKGCKGNYQKLAKLARITPVFPDIDNKRSMIYIDNLSGFIKVIIDNESAGLFLPQNIEYVKTSEMVQLIADEHEKKVHMTKFFNPIIRKLNHSLVDKVFGNLAYDLKLSGDLKNYNKTNFEQSIIQTELREL